MTKQNRWICATCCVMTIVLYTKMDGQCDKLVTIIDCLLTKHQRAMVKFFYVQHLGKVSESI